MKDIIHEYWHYFPIITAIAVLLIVAIGKQISFYNDMDNTTYDLLRDDELKSTLLKHIRQNIKLICFLLYVVIILLAVIADLLK